MLGPCCWPLIQLRDLNDIITLERVLLASWCYLEYTKMGERKCTHVHTHTNTHTHTHTGSSYAEKYEQWKNHLPLRCPSPGVGWGSGWGPSSRVEGRKKKIWFYFFSWLYSSAKSLPCRGQKAWDSVLRGANYKAACPFPGSRKWDHSPHLATRTRGHPSAVFHSSLPQSFEG